MSERTFDLNGFDTAGGVGVSDTEAVLALTDRVDKSRYARLEAIADLDRSREFEYDGLASITAFLVHHCSLSSAEAAREVRLARSLKRMPYAAKAASVGDISSSQLAELARVRRRHPVPFMDDEEMLVGAVTGLTVPETREALEVWVRIHDHKDGEDEDDEPPTKVFLAKTMEGRGRLDGDLDAATADLLTTALDSLMGEIVRHTPVDDLAPAPQRRGEALAELARRFLDSPQAPTDHGNRPHLTVVVDWATLTGDNPGGMSELLDGTTISPAHARQLACDAHICRLLTGPEREIIDLGRSQRTPSAAQWKALRVRDRHCQWPGCRRPATWCDAHHIRHWTRDLGPTDLTNLILLCRHHHTLIHRRGWELTGTAQHFTVTRPDGTHLPNAPP